MNENQMKTLLSDFAEMNIITSHEKKDTLGIKQQNQIYHYLLKSIDFTVKVNKSYSTLIQNCFYFENIGGKHQYFFSLNQLKDRNFLIPISLKQATIDRICDNLAKNKPLFCIDLEDVQFIESNYNIEYREFIGVIAYLIKQTHNKYNKIKTLVNIEKVRGSRVTLRIREK